MRKNIYESDIVIPAIVQTPHTAYFYYLEPNKVSVGRDFLMSSFTVQEREFVIIHEMVHGNDFKYLTLKHGKDQGVAIWKSLQLSTGTRESKLLEISTSRRAL